jgi:MerR family transcriptional regulator, copper efflux regulator
MTAFFSPEARGASAQPALKVCGLTLDSGPESRVYAGDTNFEELAMQALGIGQLAKRGGVGIDTVRYYERNGLLTPQMRLASGYRRYSEVELARLRFIRRAQGLGFTLKEIKQLLALSAQRDVGRVKRSAQVKLLDVKARIAALERVRDGLATLIEACPGQGRAAACPILRALTEEDDQ